MAASSSTLSFGNVQKSKSSNLSETLTNTGGSAVTISEANINGTGFSVSGLSLPTTLSPKESYTDNTVAAGQTYYYVATAVDGSGNESGYSNQPRP